MNRDIITEFVFLVVIAALCSAGAYHVGKQRTYSLGVEEGRLAERESLTKALRDSVATTYRIGRGDAERDCREGLIK